ncbi:hypothetical protein Hdeb2414_s0054g00755081 [Helianthus debilis subsp. tardiflorus]
MATCWKKYSWLLVPLVLNRVRLLARLMFQRSLLPLLHLLGLLTYPPPPHDDLGEKKQDDVEVEQVGEGGAGDAGGAGGDDRGKGVEIEAESSEATPRHTIYTRRPPRSGGGATSGVPRSPEFENIRAGSWDTHNPACADLPHAPWWKLTQGSQMSDYDNCREFFSLSPPC